MKGDSNMAKEALKTKAEAGVKVKPDDREKLKLGVTGKGMDETINIEDLTTYSQDCLLYTSPSPRD